MFNFSKLKLTTAKEVEFINFIFKFISINFINQFKFIACISMMESWLKRSISKAYVSDSLGWLNKYAKIQSAIKYRQYKDSYALMEFTWSCTDSKPPKAVFFLGPYTVKQFHEIVTPAAAFDHKTCLSCR